MNQNLVDQLHGLLAQQSAADVAELFLSPTVDEKLFHLALDHDEGPALWMVNRSDVYTPTLQRLEKHPSKNISGRAQEKIKMRLSKLLPYAPPVIEGDLSQAPEYEIENILGHPLAPFEAMLYFLHHPNPDFRASAVLSLSRRLIEFPPHDHDYSVSPNLLIEAFGRSLSTDLAPMVRAYGARCPIFPASLLGQAFADESHPLVKGRLLQNPNFPWEVAMKHQDQMNTHPFLECIYVMDERVPAHSLSTCQDSLAECLRLLKLKN